MASSSSTVDLQYFRQGEADEPMPGLAVIYLADKPVFSIRPLDRGQLEIGRETPEGLSLDDRTMSRRHARVSFVDGAFEVEDLGSRNGLVADGSQVGPGERRRVERVLRLGRTIVLVASDVRPLAGAIEVSDGIVVGPRLRQAWQALDSVAEMSQVVHIRGESGAGKELAAQRFHAAGGRASTPFVAVNCATIPTGVAERLLFGARKGSFSGAHADSEGLVQAANRGTLFLDEIGELELDVQAKLLRVIETRTVMAMGDIKPVSVSVRLVSATHRDLRQQVAERTFREDLFFRVGRPEVAVPALRERAEEIPWIIDRAVREVDDTLTVLPELVEAAVLRDWPGNVRELLLEAREAARRAREGGATAVGVDHLDERAGRAHAPVDAAPDKSSPRIEKSTFPSREIIEATLRDTRGRVATAARILGMHRNQLRRWLEEQGVDPQAFAKD